jgi:hypothetical protein
MVRIELAGLHGMWGWGGAGAVHAWRGVGGAGGVGVVLAPVVLVGCLAQAMLGGIAQASACATTDTTQCHKKTIQPFGR